MTIKSILVHADDSPQSEHRFGVAVALARSFDAHLSAIYVIPPPIVPAMMSAGYVPDGLIAEQEEMESDRAKSAKEAFERHMARAGVAAEWRERHGALGNIVGMNARYSDLTIVSQADPSAHPGFEAIELPAEVALSAGRPVLVIPYIGPGKSVGGHVLVGWNASREATRAVNDAIPLLQRAKRVTVLAVNPKGGSGGHGEVPAADISLHLARHGVKVEAAQTVTDDIDVGDAMLSRASDLGADMIVIGAYGHSRMREFILGGVTRHLLSHMTVPLLISH
jgi:nucleotide-binding universal stress UspA family protein